MKFNPKILIIGQAPPLKKQLFPYDSTLLYEMLSWVGVSKLPAQLYFDFEALTNVFPGKTLSGSHKPPSPQMVSDYWDSTLRSKVIASEKVILLGAVPNKYFYIMTKNYAIIPKVLTLLHPSRRNYSKIMKDKEAITQKLKDFLFS